MKKPQKAIIRKGDKYLMVLRAPNSVSFPGYWDFPGGKLDPGETKQEALTREVFEETSLAVQPGKIVGIYNVEVNGEVLEFSVHDISDVQGEIKLSDEHTDFKWLTKDELLQLDKLEPFIKMYFKENSE